MTKEQIEQLTQQLDEVDDLRQLHGWKAEAQKDMNNIRFQMKEFKRKDNRRKELELAKTNRWTTDDEGEQKYNRQRLAYDKRVELVQKIDQRIGEIRRQKENDYYHWYHAIARKTLDSKTEHDIHLEALKASGND